MVERTAQKTGRTGQPPAGGVTNDHLLNGRIQYAQPREGLRATIDPILLAAAVPARPGERLLEGGTGAGAALLCVRARVAGVRGIGIDRDIGLLRLARANADANAWPELRFIAGDLAACPIGGVFDHAFANPPYHDAAGTRSPSGVRENAKRSSPGFLDIWVGALARPLRDRGTLTLMLRPGLLAAALTALRDHNVAAECVFPIWPKEGRPARLILIQGRKHGRTPLTLAPGLVLHEESGEFRPEAQSILRGGAALPMTGR